MAGLFDRERSVITKHIGNVFAEGELPEEGNVQELHFAHSSKPVKLYSLNVIISVGYRVKSQRGTQFRIWATGQLRDMRIEGRWRKLQALRNTSPEAFFLWHQASLLDRGM